MKTNPNSYDVARAAGVSRTVVSLVINGNADKYQIAKATQERVRAAVRETGYTPNMTLRNMFLKRREMVKAGGITADPARMKGAVEPGLKAAGFAVETVTISTDPAIALAQITAALKSGMVTLIAPAVQTTEEGREVSNIEHISNVQVGNLEGGNPLPPETVRRESSSDSGTEEAKPVPESNLNTEAAENAER